MKYVEKWFLLNSGMVKGKKMTSLWLPNWALLHEGVWGSGCIDPHFLDLGTSWRWVFSFTARPLYHRRKSSSYPLDRRLGGPQGQSGRQREVKILAPTGSQTPTPWSSSPYPVAVPTALTRLSIMGYYFKQSHCRLTQFSINYSLIQLRHAVRFEILATSCINHV
jgi:hypothetical protein